MHHNTPQTCLPAQTRNSLCCREALYDSWWIYRTAGVKLIGGELPDDGTITNHEQQLKKDILYVNHVTCTAYRMNSRLSIKGTFLQGKEGSVILNSSRGPEFSFSNRTNHTVRCFCFTYIAWWILWSAAALSAGLQRTFWAHVVPEEVGAMTLPVLRTPPIRWAILGGI